MKSVLFVVVANLAFVATVHARNIQETQMVYTCTPAQGQINGLNIEHLALKISTEDPEAQMTLSYSNGAKVNSNLAYDATSTKYDLFPETQRDGKISVVLELQSNKWIASLKHANLDTFSTLTCSRWF